MFKKIKRYIHSPYYALGYDLIKKHPSLMSDKYYLSVLWKMVMGYEIDWKHPRTFNEKLQWLKLYDRKPVYTTMVDKYRVKQWVADKIGKGFIIPTLAVYHSVEDIVLDDLPNQFVLKCNHDSGSIVICKDKSSFDLCKARQTLGKALEKNFYWEAREWPYKNVEPCVFAEEFIENKSDVDLHDYKVLCFEGEPKLIEFHSGRNTSSQHQEFYDPQWELTSISQGGPYKAINQRFPKPGCLEEMLSFSRLLSQGTHHVRVDWYVLENDVLKFGELTFFDGGGFEAFEDSLNDYLLGSWIHI